MVERYWYFISSYTKNRVKPPHKSSKIKSTNNFLSSLQLNKIKTLQIIKQAI